MNLNLDIFKIKTNNLSPLKGRALIAEPFLPGSYFNRSIILLVDHNEAGSVGFILNKAVDFPVADFNKEFPNIDLQLSIGGPVNINSVYYIHSLGKHVPGSLHIAGDLYWGGDYEHLKDLLNSGFASPNEVRFFLGYSGWGEKQLTEELEENSWIVTDIPAPMILQINTDLWKDLVKMQDEKYQLWENYPEDPRMN